jgi:hypothetical protein
VLRNHSQSGIRFAEPGAHDAGLTPNAPAILPTERAFQHDVRREHVVRPAAQARTIPGPRSKRASPRPRACPRRRTDAIGRGPQQHAFAEWGKRGSAGATVGQKPKADSWRFRLGRPVSRYAIVALAGNWRNVMRALLTGLAVAILSASAAQADQHDRQPAVRYVTTNNCSATTGFAISPVQCAERMAKDYGPVGCT